MRARHLCERSNQPIAEIFLEAMRWRNVPLEDLERVLSTSRHEAAYELKRGLWMIGTIGSLAPYVGLFGTVVGIIRAFADMAEHGAGGFEVVAAGISEALIATAAGLAVAIIALLFFNYLQTRVGPDREHLRALVRALRAGAPVPRIVGGARTSGAIRVGRWRMASFRPDDDDESGRRRRRRDQHHSAHRRVPGAARDLHGHDLGRGQSGQEHRSARRGGQRQHARRA